MTTELLYLNDTYQLTGSAKIVGVGRAEKGGFLELDKTVFYPQGGGQPSDRGEISVGDQKLPITFVGFSEGIVQHFVPESYFSEDLVGSEAEMLVEEPTRMLGAKYHSAGHLISHVLETMQPKLIPIKGYHFTNGAHVEFVDNERVGSGEMIDDVNRLIASDIEAGVQTRAFLSDFDEVSAKRPNLAPFIPKDKPTRMVQMGDYLPLPCGGTHVHSLSELAGLKVTKIKRKKDNVKVSYEI